MFAVCRCHDRVTKPQGQVVFGVLDLIFDAATGVPVRGLEKLTENLPRRKATHSLTGVDAQRPCTEFRGEGRN
jgi:hypothetical protein